MNEAIIEIVDILLGFTVMITAIVLVYLGLRKKPRRQELKELADGIAAEKQRIDGVVNRFDALLKDLAADHQKRQVLKSRTAGLEEVVAELSRRRSDLEGQVTSMTDINAELKCTNAEHLEKAEQLRKEIQQKELAVRELEDRVRSLSHTREGLEIALGHLDAEELAYLSKPISSLGIYPSVRERLSKEGILYIGDLIPLSEEYLQEIWGVGPVTLEKIRTKMKENGVWFGMEIIRVNDRWYRRKEENPKRLVDGRE